MSNLLPLPPVNSIAFGFAQPGEMSQPWVLWVNSLDDRIHAAPIPLAAMRPIPSDASVVMHPSMGFLTDYWARYFNGVDQTIRTSGWDLTKLKPLPPTIGWAISNLPSGVLTQPWQLYFSGIDAIVRSNT